MTPVRPREAERGYGSGPSQLDPANAKRSDMWAQRKKNETWAALIGVWSEVLAPVDRTEFTLNSPDGRPAGRIVLGRTNAYSRPA